eukprot:6172078-Amphidinium_carterae.1
MAMLAIMSCSAAATFAEGASWSWVAHPSKPQQARAKRFGLNIWPQTVLTLSRGQATRALMYD